MKKFSLQVGLALFALVFFGIYSVFHLGQSSEQRLVKRIQAISASGDPVCLSAYWEGPIDPEENGVVQLEVADGDLEKFDQKYQGLSLLGYVSPRYKLGGGQLHYMNGMFAEVPGLLPQLRRVAECGQSIDQGLIAGHPFDVDLGNKLKNWRLAVKALTINALAAAHRGDGDEALANCTIALDLQMALRSMPSVLTFLVEAENENLVFETANHVLRISKPSKQTLSEFKQALARIDHRATLMDAIKGERVFGLAALQQLRDGEGAGDFGAFPFAGTWFAEVYLNDDEEMYLDLIETNLAAVGLPRGKRSQVLGQAVAKLDESTFRYAMSKMITPCNEAGYAVLDQIDAKLLAMQLVCDAADQLNEPGTVLPVIKHLDPYSEMPMQIKQLPGGLTVYSVGNNQVDDGGSVLVQDASGNALDIGFGPLLDVPSKAASSLP